MNNHIITTRNGQGKALKCLHCNRFSRLKLQKGLMNYAKELADFERVHQYCQPQADGRGLRYARPTQPIISKEILCEVCVEIISKSDGKIPLWRADNLEPLYCHVGCEGWLTAYYQVGHHNLVIQSEGEWLYFWQGFMGSARNKAEAAQALAKLRDNRANATTNDGGAIG